MTETTDKTEPGRQLRVAAVQAAPVFLDRAATVEKACSLIQEAGKGGARLIAFGENFLPGHPLWFHALPPTDARSIALATALVDNAITVPGSEVDALAEAAAAAGAMVVMGVVERPDPRVSVIHGAQLVLNPDGTLAGLRRKIVPAVGERLFLTPGGGDSIRIFDSPWGPISALAGGENSNALLTYAMRSLGARIHIATWPPHFHEPGIMHNVMTTTGRAIAYQNSGHVVAVAGAADPTVAEQLAGTKDHQANLEAMADDPGSIIYGPGGRVLAGPQRGEGILYADIDPTAGTWAQLVNRQYDRPDLLRLVVSQRPMPPMIEFEDANASETNEMVDDAARGWDRAEHAIRDRFGDRLTADEVAELAPYVMQTVRRSEELEALDLTTDDPRSTRYTAERDDPP